MKFYIRVYAYSYEKDYYDKSYIYPYVDQTEISEIYSSLNINKKYYDSDTINFITGVDEKFDFMVVNDYGSVCYMVIIEKLKEKND